MNSNLNLNIDQKTFEMCVREIRNIGSTGYQNICNGDYTIVQWGALDWIGMFITPFVFFLLLLIATVALWKMYKLDIR